MHRTATIFAVPSCFRDPVDAAVVLQVPFLFQRDRATCLGSTQHRQYSLCLATTRLIILSLVDWGVRLCLAPFVLSFTLAGPCQGSLDRSSRGFEGHLQAWGCSPLAISLAGQRQR